MMKKILNLWLIALLTVGLAMGVASCKDDDDNNNSSGSGTQEEQLAEQSNDFWAVVGQLVGTTNATDDYKDKTFEPIIGEPLTGNETVRRVMVNTMKSAAERFESLVGLDEGTVTAETPSYTWKSDAVGTLTYTKSQDGRSLATVDVSIRQVPGLRQIVFLTPEQMGTNASEDDWLNCYYHFGDVIKRKVTEGGRTWNEYWICVRPSFDPEGKKKSYWASVSPLPKKNNASYTASTNMTYHLPTKLGQDDNQMENLAEMLYAIKDPMKWENNITSNLGGIFSSSIDIFQDFHSKNIKYFSQQFWERVAKGWATSYGGKADLWELVFGMQQEEFNRCFDQYGLHLLYYGYKWKWSISNNLTLYEQVFTTKGTGTKSNMHNRQKRTISHDVIYKDHNRNIYVNVRSMCTEKIPYLTNKDLTSMNGSEKFFGSDADDMPHYIFRFATGEELAKQSGAAYDKRTNIPGFDNVYVYTEKYGLNVKNKCEKREDIQNEVAEPLAKAELFSILGSDGQFYASVAVAERANVTPVGVVVDLQDARYPVEDDMQYTGLVLGLQDIDECQLQEPSDKVCQFEHPKNLNDTPKNGLATTRIMQQGCGDLHHVHPAALRCQNYAPKLTKAVREQKGFSEWFIPSFGQMVEFFECATDNNIVRDFGNFKTHDKSKSEIDFLRQYFTPSGAASYIPHGNYWTCSFYSAANYWSVIGFDESQANADKNGSISRKSQKEIDSYKVRPMLAF